MDWDEAASSWDEREDVRAYGAAAYDSLTRRCETLNFPLAGNRAFDFGCGTGVLSQHLATQCKDVVALDRSEKMVDVLRAKASRLGLTSLTAIAADLSPALLRDSMHFHDPFDLVTCSSVCAFVDDYPNTVKLLAQCLRPGGLFVQWDWELDPKDDEPFGLTRDGIRAALVDAGMEPVYVDTGFSVTHEDHAMTPLMGIGRK